jgi:hypothetical protein
MKTKFTSEELNNDLAGTVKTGDNEYMHFNEWSY